MLAAHCPGFLRIRDAQGQELIRLGERVSGALPSTVQRVLPVSMAPMHDIEISVEDGPLLQDAARVLAIHLLVGLVLGLGFFRTPVRALRRAIRELDETHAQLLQSDKIGAIGEAYAGLTHEINNPLAIILSRVRLMRAREQEKRLDAEVSRDLEVIERQGSRIAELVRGLLAFARKRDFHMRETDLNQVVEETAALIRKPFEKKGITIRTELVRSLPRLWASPPHLQQVFLNLLNNARDAMPEGGRIVIRTLQVDGSLVAEVEDSGTGLAQGVGDRVFEPFFTTKEKGTGLGLSVSYGTIKAHAGEMTVESETGKGTLFRVTLPIERRALK
jgi:signal transduction histidine kinase